MICDRCDQKVAAKQARQVKVGAGYKRLCGDCANVWDGRHDRIEAGLAKREQDRRRHNSERLAALDAETPARHARMARVLGGSHGY